MEKWKKKIKKKKKKKWKVTKLDEAKKFLFLKFTFEGSEKKE